MVMEIEDVSSLSMGLNMLFRRTLGGEGLGLDFCKFGAFELFIDWVV